MTLDQMGLAFGTDKSSSGHGYLAFYERFFSGLRTRKANILEIGIFDGASLKTWEAYFENSRIVGADINPATRRFAGGRIAVEIVDQSDLEQMVGLAIKHGPFDIVIEDGSHQWEHQVTSLRTLFPFLRKGGLYIAEDLQTNYGALERDYRGVASRSCVEYLKRAVDLRVADDQLDISQEEDAFLRTYARHMNLTFYRRACIIEKTYDPQDLAAVEALVAVDTDQEDLFISAHVGNVGDVHSASGSLRSGRPDGNIQGFTMTPQTGSGHPLRYRARLADGGWTGWVAPGEFVGTRGITQDLTGFSVRLLDPGGEFVVQSAALFRGEDGPVRAGDAEPCVASSGLRALHGMQVILRRKHDRPTSAASTTGR